MEATGRYNFEWGNCQTTKNLCRYGSRNGIFLYI